MTLVDFLHSSTFLGGDRLHSQPCPYQKIPRPFFFFHSKRMVWFIRSSADGSNRLDPLANDTSGGKTRLVKTFVTLRSKLNARLRELRKDALVKILFFLLGFYCATAFATVIGQTGDWDILSAALAVAVVEGIGALMYKASGALVAGVVHGVIVMVNYWKAGLAMGLFLDSFKY